MLDAARDGRLDVFYVIGGNFLETMPDPAAVDRALRNVPVRIHQDLILNTSMLAEPGEMVLLLPAQTRYEQRGGGTATSTERRIRFTPEIPAPSGQSGSTSRGRPAEARPEWEILSLVAQRALPDSARRLIEYTDVRQIMEEMERVMPLYRGIKDGKYPRPIRLGPQTSRWLKRELVAVIERLAAERENPQPDPTRAAAATGA